MEIQDLEKQIKALEVQKQQLQKQLEQEKLSMVHPNEKVAKYLKTTYNGQSLFHKHKLDEEGVWEIYGEDPNCDFGGPHHTPKLGTFSGKLSNVLEIALQLSNFYTWGGGGEIIKIKIEAV